MADASGVGPWFPERESGWKKLPWVVRREKPGWPLGVQTMTKVNFTVRRFATEEAARKAADAANASASGSGAQQEGGANG